jgi:hypothetical protein
MSNTLTHQITLSNADIEGLLLMRTAASLLAEKALIEHRKKMPYTRPDNYVLYSRALAMSNRFWDSLDFIKKTQEKM